MFQIDDNFLKDVQDVLDQTFQPARSSSHRYCPASPQNSHLQLSGTCSSEPQSPETEVELEFDPIRFGK